MKYFDLPTSTLVDRVLPKNQFDLYTDTKQKKLFTDKVEKIRWKYKLAPDTINLPKQTIEEIQVFVIELKKKDRVPVILDIMNKVIPYGIVGIVLFGEEFFLTTAATHEHPTNPDRRVVDWLFTTSWKPSHHLKKYSFQLERNLDFVYFNMCKRITDTTARSCSNLKELVKLEQRLDSLRKEVDRLETKVKKTKQFNKRVEYNQELTKVRSDLRKLSTE